jgi:hypothetical protein
MKRENIIYIVAHPLTGQVMYIGQTVNFKRRTENYIYKNKKEVNSKRKICVWVKELHKLNLKPTVFVLERVAKRDYLNIREIYWISKLNPPLNTEKGGYYARGKYKYKTKYRYDLRKIKRMIRQGYTLKQIGKEFDCPKNIMGSFLRKNSLKTKNAQNCNPDGSFISIPSRQVINQEELFDLYCNQLLTCTQIAKLKDCSKTAILAWLKKHDIPRRTRPESMKIRYKKGMKVGFRDHDAKGNKI